VTVIAARQFMRVLVCVLLCMRRLVTVIAARRCMRVSSVCFALLKAYAHGGYGRVHLFCVGL